MKVLVTGATGFVGSHVARLLVEEGREVRALVRPGSYVSHLEALDIELALGDLRDRESVRAAMTGCSTVYHVAADYRLWVLRPWEMFDTNVRGTTHVLEAALGLGVDKVVYTSTVGALGIPGDGTPGTEDTPVSQADMCGPYKRSKYLAEQEALRYASLGLPVVIVNPSTPVGPEDRKPTPTGKMIVDFLNRRMPAFLDTGLNLVHVRDVARGHLLACDRGKVGEKYILGNENLTLADLFVLLAEVSGIPAPKVRLPYTPVLMAAYVSEGVSRWVTRKEPRIPLNAVKMARKHMFFDSRKAIRELGLPQTPVKQALQEAVSWFREHGYAGRTGGSGTATQ